MRRMMVVAGLLAFATAAHAGDRRKVVLGDLETPAGGWTACYVDGSGANRRVRVEAEMRAPDGTNVTTFSTYERIVDADGRVYAGIRLGTREPLSACRVLTWGVRDVNVTCIGFDSEGNAVSVKENE